jgi:hypothetical protein
MITTIMAAFAFGYCVADIVINYHYNKKYNELLKSTVETEK